MAHRRRACGAQGRAAYEPKRRPLAASHHSLAPGAGAMTQAPVGLVTLLTDFGLRDPFVGVMKGVLLAAHPALCIVDITHGIRAGVVGEGAFWLERSFRYFPAGTVHCAVVEPGVGSARAAVALAAERH